jgi:hypothetical protein
VVCRSDARLRRLVVTAIHSPLQGGRQRPRNLGSEGWPIRTGSRLTLKGVVMIIAWALACAWLALLVTGIGLLACEMTRPVNAPE